MFRARVVRVWSDSADSHGEGLCGKLARVNVSLLVEKEGGAGREGRSGTDELQVAVDRFAKSHLVLLRSDDCRSTGLRGTTC